jgi:type VI secretion system protein ImpC
MSSEKQKEEVGANLEEMTESEGGVLDRLLSKVNMDMPEDQLSLDQVIQGKASSGGGLTIAIDHLIREITATGTRVEKLDKNLIDVAIARIDEKISNQMNEILHHEQFQQMESAWMGLWFAVEKTDFRQNIQMEILNCSKEKLLEDFEESPETVQSGLYKQLYEREYDQPGANPVTAMVANYEFDKTPQDLQLLQNIAKVAAATHSPFISSVGASFFGETDLAELPKKPDISEIFTLPEYIKWNSFRKSEDSRYVGLTMNRFMLRMPYTEDNVKTFNFKEDVLEGPHKYLWGNPAFAFLGNLNRCFAKHGWAVNIRGPQSGGKVEDLPVHVYESSGGTQTRIPTEIMLSERKEFELAENGFIPLSIYKNSDYAVFFSAQSAQKPTRYDSVDATANAKLSANLPYLFLVSRLSHYLKVLQREEIGGATERDELEKGLNEWIKKLVTDSSSPTAEQKAKYPLRDASVSVTENPESPGFYTVTMKVRPHFQVEGVNVDLSLVSKMPSK